jgi:hypothetical protein
MVTKEHGVSKAWRYESLSRYEAEAVSDHASALITLPWLE